MARAIQQLREKLYRELARSERDAVVHCCRQARRLGAQPPAYALHAIADHAATLAIWSHASSLAPRQASAWARTVRATDELASLLRHLVLEVLFGCDGRVDAERAYRATLLELRHGLDVARLLREVLLQNHDYPALTICDQLLAGRAALLAKAEDRLRWFAHNPDVALRPSRPSALTAAASRA